MSTVLRVVRGACRDAVRSALERHHGGAELVLPKMGASEVAVVSRKTTPKQQPPAQFPHYQCNSAMRLFNSLVKSPSFSFSSPQSLAAAVAAELENAHTDILCSATVAGPGFINITLQPSFVNQTLLHDWKSKDWAMESEQGAKGESKCAIVDYGSPNIAKTMHVGHMRSCIQGEAMCRLFETHGYQVVRVNHVGDWGTPMGVLIAHLKSSPDIDLCALQDLQSLYETASTRFKQDKAFQKLALQETVWLQTAQNQETIEIWQQLRQISRVNYQSIFDALGVYGLLERGESFYGPLIHEALQELIECDAVVEMTEEEQQERTTTTTTTKQNALMLSPECSDFPIVVRKQDEGYTYCATDLACVKYRMITVPAEMQCSHVTGVYVTDIGQAGHFSGVFRAGTRAGWINHHERRAVHAPFGLVLAEDGKKFSSRRGTGVALLALLQEAESRCYDLLTRKYKEKQIVMDEEVLARNAKLLGNAAIKYFDLKRKRNSDYTFSFDQMLDFNGNTGVYVLYTYARVASLVDRIKATTTTPATAASTATNKQRQEESLNSLDSLNWIPRDKTEGDILSILLQHNDVMERAMETLEVHVLCDFLFDLCQAFNRFYSVCHVVNAETLLMRQTRGMLTEMVQHVLKTDLNILGIETIDRL